MPPQFAMSWSHGRESDDLVAAPPPVSHRQVRRDAVAVQARHVSV